MFGETACVMLAALTWTCVGSECDPGWTAGFDGGDFDGPVYAIATFDDGNGPATYVGGAFTTAGGLPASNVARWDGATWTPLDEGTSGRVRALAVFDDGRGPALYVGGGFEEADGRLVAPIAAHVVTARKPRAA